jgi:hypothetical protein
MILVVIIFRVFQSRERPASWVGDTFVLEKDA